MSRIHLEAAAYAEIKASLARRAVDVPDDAVTRLRAFGERLVQDGLVVRHFARKNDSGEKEGRCGGEKTEPDFHCKRS